MQRRIILAATALAAALVVPTVATATDKEVGPGDRGLTEAMQNRLQGGSNSQSQMAVGGPTPQNQMAVGGHGQGSNDATVGQVGGTPTGQAVGQAGSEPTGTGVGQAGGNGPTESTVACGSVKAKTPKDDAGTEKQSSKLPKDDPAGDATVEAELREQQQLIGRLTERLNELQQRQNDVIRSMTGG